MAAGFWHWGYSVAVTASEVMRKRPSEKPSLWSGSSSQPNSSGVRLPTTMIQMEPSGANEYARTPGSTCDAEAGISNCRNLVRSANLNVSSSMQTAPSGNVRLRPCA